MFRLPESKDIPVSNLYTPNVKSSSWAGFLLRNWGRNKVFVLTAVSPDSGRTGLLLTWPAVEAAANGKNPATALTKAIKQGHIRKLRRMPQKEAFDFAQNPQEGVACIVTRRYYDEPLGLILPDDVVEKLRAA